MFSQCQVHRHQVLNQRGSTNGLTKYFPHLDVSKVRAPTQATIMKLHKANVERFKLNLLLRAGGRGIATMALDTHHNKTSKQSCLGVDTVGDRIIMPFVQSHFVLDGVTSQRYQLQTSSWQPLARVSRALHLCHVSSAGCAWLRRTGDRFMMPRPKSPIVSV